MIIRFKINEQYKGLIAYEIRYQYEGDPPKWRMTTPFDPNHSESRKAAVEAMVKDIFNEARIKPGDVFIKILEPEFKPGEKRERFEIPWFSELVLEALGIFVSFEAFEETEPETISV